MSSITHGVLAGTLRMASPWRKVVLMPCPYGITPASIPVQQPGQSVSARSAAYILKNAAALAGCGQAFEAP